MHDEEECTDVELAPLDEQGVLDVLLHHPAARLGGDPRADLLEGVVDADAAATVRVVRGLDDPHRALRRRRLEAALKRLPLRARRLLDEEGQRNKVENIETLRQHQAREGVAQPTLRHEGVVALEMVVQVPAGGFMTTRRAAASCS